jgi:hypothetical protein
MPPSSPKHVLYELRTVFLDVDISDVDIPEGEGEDESTSVVSEIVGLDVEGDGDGFIM